MYRNDIADLSLCVDDIHEEYIAKAKSILISGTALAQSPNREAALKAVLLARHTNTPIIFDIDYRAYNWAGMDDVAIYCSLVARDADIIIGSREEYTLAEKLLLPAADDAASAAFWHSMRASVIVIKHGEKGSTAYTRDGNRFSIKPFPINKLKGFGGGDGYASAFLYGVLEGKDIIDCLEFGSASASLLVASHACAPNMPTLDRLKEYIAECKEQFGEMIVRSEE